MMPGRAGLGTAFAVPSRRPYTGFVSMALRWAV
jgi:hypothetical protein